MVRNSNFKTKRKMDFSSEIKIDFVQMKRDVLEGIQKCSQRGLNHTVKWLSEMSFALKHIEFPENNHFYEESTNELEELMLAKSYFDLKEYDRAAHFVKDCVNPKARFLYFYSRYLSIEKKKIDNMTDSNCPPDPTKNEALKDLCTELKIEHAEHKLDGYCLYLHGIILKKLDLTSVALDIFIEAVKQEPILWAAWYELGKIIPDKNSIISAQLPNHWIKYFFLAHTYLEQLRNDESLQLYNTLYSMGFQNSTYVMSQIALGHHNCRSKFERCFFII